MNIGSKFRISLIADDRLEKFGTKDPNKQIKHLDTLLKDTLKEIGSIYIESESEEDFLQGWGEKGNPEYDTIQIRKHYWLKLSKKMTTNQIYRVINSVQAQSLKIYNCR